MLARTQTPLIQIQTEAAPSRNKSWKANISRKANKARTLSDRRRSKLSQSKVELRILNPLVLSRKNWTTYSQLNRCKMTKNPPTRKRLKIPSKSKNNPMAREGWLCKVRLKKWLKSSNRADWRLICLILRESRKMMRMKRWPIWVRIRTRHLLTIATRNSTWLPTRKTGTTHPKKILFKSSPSK